MNVPFYIAKRYLKSKSGNNIINIVTILASLGVMAGTASLFVVLSVFTGIKNYSLNILEVTTPQIRISPIKGKKIEITPKLTYLLNHTPHKIEKSYILEERAFFKNKDKEEIAFIKGVDEHYTKINNVDSLLYAGQWFEDYQSETCILSYDLTRKLELNAYTDLLQIYVPKPGKGYIHNINDAFNNLHPQIIGISISQNENDNEHVYVPLAVAQKLLSVPKNTLSYIDIDVVDQNPDSIYEFLKKKLPQFKVEKSEEINHSFYKILNSEKLIAYLVSLLVVMLVLSNTSGTIIMVIMDKKENIKTLLHIGAPIQMVRRVFALYGFLLNIIGMFLGILLGSFLVYLQITYKLFMITSNIPYPIAYEFQNTLTVVATIIIFGSIAALIASGRIQKKYILKK